MRLAVISDLHANSEALNAVLRFLENLRIDEILCLGDLVGYNADPNEVVDTIRTRAIATIAGNHDRAAVGLTDPDYFDARARYAVDRTRSRLWPATRDLILALPTHLIVHDSILLTHGAVHPWPNEDVRVKSEEAAMASFETLKSRFPSVITCFFGHTHHPLVYEWIDGKVSTHRHSLVQMRSGGVYLVNPGSVGQSRDADPRASLCVYDNDLQQLEFHRVDYDWRKTAAKTLDAGFIAKSTLWTRLARRWSRTLRMVKR